MWFSPDDTLEDEFLPCSWATTSVWPKLLLPQQWVLEEWYCVELGGMGGLLTLLITLPSGAEVYDSFPFLIIPHTWQEPPEIVWKGCVDNSDGIVVCPWLFDPQHIGSLLGWLIIHVDVPNDVIANAEWIEGGMSICPN